MENEIWVVIFEGNYLLRDSYYQLINGMPGLTCAGTFDNAWELIFKIKRSDPEVVLRDIEMLGITGIEDVRIIKDSFPVVYIIMQTVLTFTVNALFIFICITAGSLAFTQRDVQALKNS